MNKRFEQSERHFVLIFLTELLPSVDRTVLHLRHLLRLLRPMEAQRWKRQSLSEFQLRTRCLSEREKAERDRGGTDKSVSLASTCRLLTDRQYVMRRPLFCAETSILKKSQELGGRRSHLEPTLGSAESGLFSSILEVHRSPKPPQRPHLSSPVLNPTYTPRSGHWRSGQMGMGGGGGTKRKTMSPHQENYWACAIPKTGPPSPDRLSVDWEPDREYQALLDYTYPLRPPQGGGTLCQDLQDSGIELDHPCSATSLSGLDLSVKSPPGGRRGSPDHLGLTRSSGLCSTPSPLTEPPSLHYSLDSGGPYRYQRCPPPLSYIGSVKSCLADYQSLQRVMSRHQPLTSCVLHTGQLLLSCINTTSPRQSDIITHSSNNNRCLPFSGLPLTSLFSVSWSSSQRRPATDPDPVWSPADLHRTPVRRHPVGHGQPDPAQSAQHRGQKPGPAPSGGPGIHLINRPQDVAVFIGFVFSPFLTLCLNTFLSKYFS
uniref:Uncharacterized protein n=1 Tax=Echeneis naucrates TaxID=173247 RepID=A0A665T3J5_ECHNA